MTAIVDTVTSTCERCGLVYSERPTTSPHFALCPRCEHFNKPAQAAKPRRAAVYQHARDECLEGRNIAGPLCPACACSAYEQTSWRERTP